MITPKVTLIDSVNDECVSWERLRDIKWEELIPFPKSVTFSSADEFYENCKRATGAIWFVKTENPEFIRWVAELVDRRC